MNIREVQIKNPTLKRDCFVRVTLTDLYFGKNYSFNMAKDCDRKRLNLLFDYAQVSDLYKLNDKFIRLAVNEQDSSKTDFIAIGHPSDDRFFLLESTTVVEMSADDVKKIYSESE